MRHMTIRAAMGSLVALAWVAPCEAQRAPVRVAPVAHNDKQVVGESRPTGFLIGLRSVASPGLSMPMEDADSNYDLKFGAGVGAIVGYGINETFSVFTSLDVAKLNAAAGESIQGSWALVDMEIGARANLPLGGAQTIPYVDASIGRRALGTKATGEDGSTFDAAISGGAFGIGGGVEHSFSKTMSLDAGVDVGFGKFTHLKAGDDEWTQNVGGTHSIRMRLGVTWRPGPRGTT